MINAIKQSRWLLAVLAALVASQAFGHGMSEAEKQTILEGGNIRYLWIGATHMLSGYDHLLFVFGIIFSLPGSETLLSTSPHLRLGTVPLLSLPPLMAFRSITS